MNENPSPLFPPLEPFKTQMLPVGDGHTLYLEQSGNPQGIPVIVLHGGPGSGSKPKHRQFFDPSLYHIIMFDQRGCGQSMATDLLAANTTQYLVQDIETIRTHLGIQSWVVYGNSWGSTLGLAYAQAHPAKVRGLILGAIFTGTRRELDWFTHPAGLARFFPNEYKVMMVATGNPQPEQLMARINTILQKNDAAAIAAARAVCLLDAISMDLEPNLAEIETFLNSPEFSLTPVRIWAHYFAQECFLTPQQLLKNAPAIAHLPIILTQAGLDLCCPPETALSLHAALPQSEMTFIHLCGHRANPAMEATRITATNAMAARLSA